MTGLEKILHVIDRLYPPPQLALPREFLLLRAVAQLGTAADIRSTARAARTTPANLRRLAEASDPILSLYGLSYEQAATSSPW